MCLGFLGVVLLWLGGVPTRRFDAIAVMSVVHNTESCCPAPCRVLGMEMLMSRAGLPISPDAGGAGRFTTPRSPVISWTAISPATEPTSPNDRCSLFLGPQRLVSPD